MIYVVIPAIAAGLFFAVYFWAGVRAPWLLALAIVAVALALAGLVFPPGAIYARIPLVLALGAGLFGIYLLVRTVQPLVESGVVTAEEWQRVEDEASTLLNRRDRLIAELRDLEFEAALNKIDASEMDALRVRYEAEALNVVRASRCTR